jgi:hypothetical protein
MTVDKFIAELAGLAGNDPEIAALQDALSEADNIICMHAPDQLPKFQEELQKIYERHAH